MVFFFFPLFSSQKGVYLFHEDLFSAPGQGPVPSYNCMQSNMSGFSLKDRGRVGKLWKIMPGNNV